MRTARLIAILLLLESRGKIKARELAEALETSVRTVYRDIDVLCEAGIPIYSTTGPNGGVSFVDGYKIDMNRLNSDDIVNLYLTGAGIPQDYQKKTNYELKNTLIKLKNNLPPQYANDVDSALKRFYFDSSPWWEERSFIEFYEILRQAVFQSRVIHIKYKKSNGEVSERTVCPYGLVSKNSEWYMAAFCKESESVKTFKCNRLIDIMLLEGSFSYPEEFSLEKYWQKSVECFKEAVIEKENYEVTIKLLKSSSHILKSFAVRQLNEKDGYLHAVVEMVNYEEARVKSMDIAGQAEIIKPEELRQYVKKELVGIIERYQ